MKEIGALSQHGVQTLSSSLRLRKVETADESVALREFDSYFLGEMLRIAAKPAQEEGFMDGGSAGRMYRDFFLQEIARIVAKHGDFGVAGQLTGELQVASDAGHEQEEPT